MKAKIRQCQVNRKIITEAVVAVSVLAPLMAKAQTGWTLAQCREHFGREFSSDDSTYYFHVGPWGRGLGEHVYITFDPDGTVGGIQWLKLDGKAFSEAEVQKRLRKASNITWERATNHEPDELKWVGIQHGKVVFDANEGDNGRGTYILSISTR